MYVKEKQFSVSLLYNFFFHTKIIKATIPSDLSLKIILQGGKKNTLIFNHALYLLLLPTLRAQQCQILISTL